MPICTGENLYTRHGFRELVETQATDIISPDLAKAGGLSEGRRIADLADIYYMPISPHNICGPIGTMAMAHVCAASPNFQVLEFHHLDNEVWDSLVERDLIVDGHIPLPRAPGLGVTLDEEAARSRGRGPGVLRRGGWRVGLPGPFLQQVLDGLPRTGSSSM